MGFFGSTNDTPIAPPLYPGIPGLAAADPAELAAQVFVRLFSLTAGPHVSPNAALGVLQDLSGVAEVPGVAVRGILTSPGARYNLDPLLVQCVLMWERGLLAGRLSRGSEANHHLVLLPRGAGTLAGPSPLAAAHHAMMPFSPA